jgi:hypothetical protein
MTDAPVRPRHSNHQTQWAAQFAVASELCKQGYEVALTLGNHPSVDLMAISPGLRRLHFDIDVKGLHTKNWWTVFPKQLVDNLYYIFAFVPKGSPNQFFILTQEEVNSAISDASSAARRRAEAKGLVSKFDKFPGVSWTAAAAHENAWHKLPGWVLE